MNSSRRSEPSTYAKPLTRVVNAGMLAAGVDSPGLSSTTSCAKLFFSLSSVIALPPYLMTMVLPWKRRI